MKLGIRALYKTSLEKRELRENSAVSFLLYLRVNLIFALNFVFINRVWFDSTPKRLLPSIQESDFSDTSLLTMVVGVISCYSGSCALLGYYLAITKNSAFLIYFAAQAWNQAYLLFCWRALTGRSGFRERRSLFSICHLLVWYIVETVGWLTVGISNQPHLRMGCKQWWEFNVLLNVHRDVFLE